jgi:D-amino peptidase
LRYYISADIEGIAGVASRDQLAPGRFEYEQARDWMTGTVLAACETLRGEGAEEIVVSDSHGNGQNIRVEKMPDYVRLIRSWPRPLGMMQGIDAGRYAGALLLGYHAGAHNPAGTLSHTVNGDLFQEVRLNGSPASEAMISAAIAGHFGVPVLMVSGDDVAVAETRGALPGIVAACVKVSHGFLSAEMLSLPAADALVRAAVKEAALGAHLAKPFTIETPIDLEIRLRHRFLAEWLSYLPGVERTDPWSVRHGFPDITGVSRFLQFITSARAALS